VASFDGADVDITDYNPLCGDQIRMTIISRSGILTDVKFTSQGCAVSQAAASMLTTLVIGMTLTALEQLDQQSFLDHLGITLTPARLKCALLPYSALQKALRQRIG